jgi:WD40 repeat protein
MDTTIKSWDLKGKETTLRGHAYGVISLALSPDGKRLYSGSHDSTIKVWDLQTGKDILTLRGHSAGVARLALSVDGKRLFSADPLVTKQWDLETGKETSSLELRGHTAPIIGLAFSPDGTRLFSGSVDETIKVWSLESGK